ncbi:MAG: periplasmic heavy metal sensor [bacterium]|nr:periplasmic heavy metal sensor [bacterium]
MKLLQSTILLLLVSAVCNLAAATELNLPPGKWWENPRLVERLQLTEEQRQAIHDVFFSHVRRMIDLTADVKKAELELAELVGSEEFDTAKVREVFLIRQTARQALESERFELLLAVREQLTLEQWALVQGMRQEAMRRRGDRRRMGRRGEHPPGPQQRPPGEWGQ